MCATEVGLGPLAGPEGGGRRGVQGGNSIDIWNIGRKFGTSREDTFSVRALHVEICLKTPLIFWDTVGSCPKCLLNI